MGASALEAFDEPAYDDDRQLDEVDLRNWLRREMNVALADNDLGRFVRAMRGATRTHGMSEVSRATGLDRVNLYRMLGNAGNPKMDSVLRILELYGLRLTVGESTHLAL